MYDKGMLADLAKAVAELEPPMGIDSLTEAIALRDQLDARIAEAVGAFDAEGWWAVDASASMVAWLQAHGRMTRRSAQRLRSLAARLRSLPVCTRAYADGALSGGQIEAIVAQLDDEVIGTFVAQEAELVPFLIPLTVAGVSRAMSVWVTRARPEPSEPKEPERSLHLSRTLDDRWVLDGSLDAEGGSVVATALRLATPKPDDRPGRPATRRADALVDICRFFLDYQQTHAGGRHRPHVNVVVEIQDLKAGRGGQVVDGPRLDGPTVSRLFCDCAVHRVVMAGRSAVLDYGTATRTFRRRYGTPSSSVTRAVAFPAAIDRRCGARATTSCGSPTVASPSCPISSCSAPVTTMCSTSPAGTPSSCRTRPSRSPTPRDSCAPPRRRGPIRHGDRAMC